MANQTKIYTHVCMIGRNNHKIEYDKIDIFYKWYIDNISQMHMVERVRYPCKFFIDYDDYRSDLIELLMKSYPTNSYIICINETQSGVHIIFQDIQISSPEDAEKQCKKFGDCDISVYRTGLRMIGSKKKTTPKRYYPCFRIDKDTVHTLDKQITIEMMNLCSILIPHISIEPPVSKLKTTRALKNNGVSYDFSFIHENYSNVFITKINKISHKIIILNTTTKWCQNIYTEHNSKTIYFIIRIGPKITISQRCYCRCDHTNCKTFESEKHYIPLFLYYKIIE